jgi:hypothetical protein
MMLTRRHRSSAIQHEKRRLHLLVRRLRLPFVRD